MKINKPKNPNYCATVVEIKNIIPLEGCDNVVATSIMGNQVIIGKDVKVGDIGLYFPLETQLSKEYLSANSLHRNKDLNTDKNKAGYFEENGRIRCVKFRGHKSEGLYMPIDSLGFGFGTGFTPNSFNLGDDFDELNGVEICRKYIVQIQKTHGEGNKKQKGKQPKKISKLIDNQFRFHQDTSMLYKNLHRINPDDITSITTKIHGTSGISSKILCKRPLSLSERILKRLGVKIDDKQYDYINSSRKVIKNDELTTIKSFDNLYANMSTSSKKRWVEKYYLNKYQSTIPEDIYRRIFPLDNISNKIFTLQYFDSFEEINTFSDYIKQNIGVKSKGYYGEDIWTIADKELRPYLQDGMTLYYEIVGFLPSGMPIQKLKSFVYDYGCEEKEHKIFIYRITYTNPSGRVFEFSAKQVQDWCKQNGLNAVEEVYYGIANDFIDKLNYYKVISEDGLQNFRDQFLNKIKEKYNEHDCHICKNKVPEEGVVVRIEKNEFEAYKQKSNRFYAAETESLDKGETNLEDQN